MRHRHAFITHNLNIGYIKAEQILEHARHADPSKAIPDERGWYLRDKAFYFDDFVHLTKGRSDTGYDRLMSIAKSGDNVLYRTAFGGINEKAFRPTRTAEKENEFFVVNPTTRKISFYRSILTQPEIVRMFMESEGDLHEAYWRRLNQGRKTPAENLGMSADFHPDTGTVSHIRSQHLINKKLGRGSNLALYLVHRESAIPEKTERRKTAALNFTQATLRKVGPYDHTKRIEEG